MSLAKDQGPPTAALEWGLAERQGGAGGCQRGLEQVGKTAHGLASRAPLQGSPAEDLPRRTVGTKGLLKRGVLFCLFVLHT